MLELVQFLERGILGGEAAVDYVKCEADVLKDEDDSCWDEQTPGYEHVKDSVEAQRHKAIHDVILGNVLINLWISYILIRRAPLIAVHRAAMMRKGSIFFVVLLITECSAILCTALRIYIRISNFL